jgi:hypothetical protein
MAKKKKKGGQRDTRGYATTNSVPKPKPRPKRNSNVAINAHKNPANSNPSKMAGKSVRNVHVSQSVQDQLSSLLDELKQFFDEENSKVVGNGHGKNNGDARSQQPVDFSIGDKKMIGKVAMLVSVMFDIRCCIV